MASHIPSNLVDEIPAPPLVHLHSLPRQLCFYAPTSRPRRNEELQPRQKVSLRAAIKSFPSAFMVMGVLIFALVVDIVGMAIYMVLVPNPNSGPFIIFCAMFIIVMITIAGFIFRQSIILYTLIHPPRDRQNSTLPTWLTGLPTYRDVLRTDGQSTHSPETGGWSGMLPSYGDAKGDELLMKSSMRNSRGSQDLEMGAMEGRGDVQITVETVESRPPVARV